MEIQVFSGNDIEASKDIIYAFYLPKYYPEYTKAILNSGYVVVAVSNKQVVGALRIITDNDRFAFIVDFVVDEGVQKQGVGTKIMDKAVEVCEKELVEFTGLFVERVEGLEWLVEFYEKLGFKTQDGFYMEYQDEARHD